MKATFRILAAAILFVAVTDASAQTIDFKEYKLKNGLRVILSEDHTAPTFTLSMTYNVGSRDERPGRTGFAHLFEHMMFQGSENVGKGEHLDVISLNGGTANGTTNSFRTNFFETLPSNQIQMALFLEADRMRALAITEANLNNQRSAVEEERRQRYDNQPYGLTLESLLSTLYDKFGNAHSTIGSMKDLDAATVPDVSDFFKTYYAPNNAVLVMVGDFASAPLLTQIEERFGGIPMQPVPPTPDIAESQQNAERRKTLEDPLARGARLDIAFRIPPAHNPDWYALSVLAQILTGGQSSRLYQKLVRETQVTGGPSSVVQEFPGPSYFAITLPIQGGKTPAQAQSLTFAELDRLKNEFVSDAEMEEVRISLRRSQATLLHSGTANRANRLGLLAASFNDPALINGITQKLSAVTKEDIQRVARTYFGDTNRTVILTIPKRPVATGGNQ